MSKIPPAVVNYRQAPAVVKNRRDFPPKPVQPYLPIHSSPYIIITLLQKNLPFEKMSSNLGFKSL